jgi:hypothetical protein
MTLTTHIIIAGAVTKQIPGAHPVFIFLLALASHYLSDAIPHWDYKLNSFDKNESSDTRKWNMGSAEFFQDIAKIAFDFALGSIVFFLLARPHTAPEFLHMFLTIAGSTLPDFLLGIYYTRRAEWLKPFQQFHGLMHTKIRLGPYPLIGVPFQIIIILVALIFFA